MNFSHIYDDIEIKSESIKRPNLNLFLKWRDDFLNSCNLENYDILFSGNSAENIFGKSKIPTFDIDIVISSKNNNFSCEEIKTILKNAFKLGIKNNLLIDIFHVNFNVFETIMSYKFENNNIIKIETIQTRFYDKIITKDKNNIIKKTNLNDYEKINCNLYQKKISKEKIPKSVMKHVQRIKEGHYIGIYKNLKTMQDINFDFFIKNINNLVTAPNLI